MVNELYNQFVTAVSKADKVTGDLNEPNVRKAR
jgi:hypothetical protein